jgi:hypothetical protein
VVSARRASLFVCTTALLGGVALSSGCDDAASYFNTDVTPVLELNCAATACHGVAAEAEANGEVIDWSQLFFRLDDDGHLADPAAARAISLTRVNGVTPRFSSLLRKPLAHEYGGVPHYGGDNFLSESHAGYQTLLRWIELEGSGGEDPAPLQPLERQFADTVQPVLFELSCANGNCHGPQATIPYRLQPGVGGVLSTAETRENYEQSRRMLTWGADPSRSRLLTKSLPLHHGGVLHKGGNSAFLEGPDDPRAEAIRAWACAEHTAATGEPCGPSTPPPIAGVVFVRGPIPAGHAFDLDVFAAGSDVFFAASADGTLALQPAVNLTAALHDGPADVRDLAVDPRGEKIVFAMRRARSEGHRLYELTLADGAWRQLTFGADARRRGALWTDRDPTYAPDGSIWFVSTRAGVLADDGLLLDADIYQLDPDSGAVRRRSWTPHVERKPVFFTVGKVAGEVAFSTLRAAVPEQTAGHLFRFAPDLHVEYHVHFGVTAPETLFLDVRELPDGRYVSTVGELSGAWDAGRLGIIDRNFGPELPPGDTRAASLPFYGPPLARLDPAPASERGLYRDAAPLPDGRLLVSYAPGPIDPDDESASFDLRIEVIELGEDPRGGGAVIEARSPLIDAPGVHDTDPEPVFARYPGPAVDDAPADSERALLIYNSLPMIDAILGELPPAGVKSIDERIRAVRIIEATPQPPSVRQPVAAAQTLFAVERATSTSLTPFSPARVLGELPLADDGTFQVDVPAGVSVRLQGLDERGMTVGYVHNRWFDFNPGQTMKQSVVHQDPRIYTGQCGACHGAPDGEPDHTFVEPDGMTAATITLSRFEDRNPRRPITPPALGDDTRVEIDFALDVQPILDLSCATAGCHAGGAPAAMLRLSDAPTAFFTESYEHLLAPGRSLVDTASGTARRSHLVERLVGEELDAPRELPSAEPHPSTPLSDDELATIIRWIELGASFRGSFAERP